MDEQLVKAADALAAIVNIVVNGGGVWQELKGAYAMVAVLSGFDLGALKTQLPLLLTAPEREKLEAEFNSKVTDPHVQSKISAGSQVFEQAVGVALEAVQAAQDAEAVYAKMKVLVTS